VLQAASSEGGRRMLARGYRLRVGRGQGNVVGHAAARGEPRTAPDTGANEISLDNSDLPETRSEIALPLHVRGEVIGVLDVQSMEPEAFSDADAAILQALADQVAMALSNARLLQQVQESLRAEQLAYGELSREAWKELLRARPDLGFLRDKRGISPTGDLWHLEMETALRTGRTTPGEDGAKSLAVPIKVRGHVIGVIDAHKPDDGGEWMPEQVTLLETLTEQLGLALESARLYQDAQRRAGRERLTREITDKMRRATDVEGIVQAAVDELFSALETARAFVRLGVAPSAQDDGGDKHKQ
jgi:GAF domain-containing protein